jgi:ribulose kinase
LKDVSKNVGSNAVKGIGFDATCSLAVVDIEGNPLSVSPTGKNINIFTFFLECRL